MKSKILAVIFSMILISFTGIISASSFDVSVNPKEITAKPGENINVKVSLKDIDMSGNGINILEGNINFDKEMIENVDVEGENNWKIEYNNDTNSNLNGKFLMIKDVNGIKDDEEILNLKIKIKDNIKKANTKILLKDLTSNDGNNLINIGSREININFEGIKMVNTGDSLIFWASGVMSLALIVYVIFTKKVVNK